MHTDTDTESHPPPAFVTDPAIVASTGLRVIGLLAEVQHHVNHAHLHQQIALGAHTAEGRYLAACSAKFHIARTRVLVPELATWITRAAIDDNHGAEAAAQAAMVQLEAIDGVIAPLLADMGEIGAALDACNGPMGAEA